MAAGPRSIAVELALTACAVVAALDQAIRNGLAERIITGEKIAAPDIRRARGGSCGLAGLSLRHDLSRARMAWRHSYFLEPVVSVGRPGGLAEAPGFCCSLTSPDSPEFFDLTP